jgi:hypothetical protein
MDELIRHLGRNVSTEDPLDTGSLGFGRGMRPDHVTRSVDGKRRDRTS